MTAKKPTKKTCFVIGPIGSAGTDERRHADMLLNAVIRPVLEMGGDYDYEVKRADEDADPGMINDRVIHDILKSDLAIADLSFLNPNAFWELGLRHSAMKPVIHIAAQGTKLPFDNIGHRAIFVDLGDWHSQVAAQKALSAAVNAVEATGYRVTNPITQAKASLQLRESTDSSDQMLAELMDVVRALERRLTANELATARAGRTIPLGEVLKSRIEGERPSGFLVSSTRQFDSDAWRKFENEAFERAILASGVEQEDDDSQGGK